MQTTHWKFYRMLRRYLRGSLGEAEQARFEKFLEETALPEADTVWTEADQLALFESIYKKIHEAKPVKKHVSTTRFITAATGVTVVLLVAYYLVLTLVVKPAFHSTEQASHAAEKTILTDGTLVWLKRGDKLSYYETPDGQRHAMLTGEALFEVAKDPLRPFIIQCGAAAVRVTGTSFTLRSVRDSVTLTVLTGNVRMYSGEDTVGLSVLPNETVVYGGTGRIMKTGLQAGGVPAYVHETEYNMNFTDVTLDRLFARIEKKFDVTIAVKETRINACHITADFTDHSLDKTLSMLAEVLDITYAVDGTTVTINGKGCY